MSALRSLWIIVALSLAACATPPKVASSRAEEHLADLIAQRLEVSRQVAWNKFVNHTPVRDPKREAEVLQSLVRKGAAQHLDPAFVERFFQAQITASRQVQTDLIWHWSRGATLPTYPPYDLRKHIRPKLDLIGGEMILTLHDVPATPSGWRAYTYQILRQRGIISRAASTASAPLP